MSVLVHAYQVKYGKLTLEVKSLIIPTTSVHLWIMFVFTQWGSKDLKHIYVNIIN